MTAAAMPAPGGSSLLGRLTRSLSRTPSAARRTAAFMAGLREHLPTAASLAAADFGGFTVWHHGGWFVLAASIALLHFAVTG